MALVIQCSHNRSATIIPTVDSLQNIIRLLQYFMNVSTTNSSHSVGLLHIVQGHLRTAETITGFETSPKPLSFFRTPLFHQESVTPFAKKCTVAAKSLRGFFLSPFQRSLYWEKWIPAFFWAHKSWRRKTANWNNRTETKVTAWFWKFPALLKIRRIWRHLKVVETQPGANKRHRVPRLFAAASHRILRRYWTVVFSCVVLENSAIVTAFLLFR